jgi:hypothetical protein
MKESTGFFKILSVLFIVCTAQFLSAQVIQAHVSLSNSNSQCAAAKTHQVWVPGVWHVHHRTGVRIWQEGCWVKNSRKIKRKNRRSIKRCNRR